MTERDYWPTEGWRVAEPAAFGMDARGLEGIHEFAVDTSPRLSSIVVVRKGHIVFEYHRAGFDQGSYHHIASITKSVTSALIGIAVGRGLLPGLDHPVLGFFPELDVPELDERARRIRVRHLLTMTGGWKDIGEGSAERAGIPDIVRTALHRPMVHEPGTVFHYDNFGAHLLSIILERVTGTGTASFAREVLFGPLGIWQGDAHLHLWRRGEGGLHNLQPRGFWDEKTGLPWWIDSGGHTTGWGGLHLTTRDLAKFGYLYLNDGMWDGAQIVPRDYVRESTRAQNSGGPGPEPGATPYGYLWWVPEEPKGMYYGWGAGRQHLYVVPALDLVVAMNSHLGRNDPGRIIDRLVLPAARG